jgi:hypothetical protein
MDSTPGLVLRGEDVEVVLLVELGELMVEAVAEHVACEVAEQAGVAVGMLGEGRHQGGGHE